MTTNPSFEAENRDESSTVLRSFQQTHQEDIEAITIILAKITSLASEEIKPHIHTMLSELIKSKECPFHETANPEERARAFRNWSESHRGMNLPYLSDYAVSRESMYEDEHM